METARKGAGKTEHATSATSFHTGTGTDTGPAPYTKSSNNQPSKTTIASHHNPI